MPFGGFLRQSTAATIIIGPFVDSTDGNTEETGFTISQADVILSKNGATSGQKNDSGSCTHRANGLYACPLDATDTNTVGRLDLWAHESGGLIVHFIYQVIEEAVYDAMYATDAVGPALASVLGALTTAASTGDPGTTITLMGYAKQLINILIGADGIATFPAEAAPANAVSLAEVIRAIHADVTGLNGEAMRGTNSAALASVCTEARLAELDGANLPTDIAGVQSDTDNIQTRIPAALVSGRMDASVGAINDNVAAAVRLALSAGQMIPGTVDNGTFTPTTTQFEADDITEATADHFNGRNILWTSGALIGQMRPIADYALQNSIGFFTVSAMTEAPANNDTFLII